jgi:hypothetical protein
MNRKSEIETTKRLLSELNKKMYDLGEKLSDPEASLLEVCEKLSYCMNIILSLLESESESNSEQNITIEVGK